MLRLKNRVTIHRQQIREPGPRQSGNIDICAKNKSPKFQVFLRYIYPSNTTDEVGINKENTFI